MGLKFTTGNDPSAAEMSSVNGPLMGVQESVWHRVYRLGGGIVPYLAFLAPFVDRLFAAKPEPVVPALLPALQDLKSDINDQVASLRASQVDVSPAIEEQQRRLDKIEEQTAKLEEQTAELNNTIANLCEDHMDLSDQVRMMSVWVRNAAIAGLFLLTLMLILKAVQMFHSGGH